MVSDTAKAASKSAEKASMIKTESRDRCGEEREESGELWGVKLALHKTFYSLKGRLKFHHSGVYIAHGGITGRATRRMLLH